MWAAIWRCSPEPVQTWPPPRRHYHPNFFSVRPEKMCLYPDSHSDSEGGREVSGPQAGPVVVGEEEDSFDVPCRAESIPENMEFRIHLKLIQNRFSIIKN